MSTKAQRVLGVVPDGEQHSSSHASRQASLRRGQSSMASRRQSTDNNSMPFAFSYHPTFSIVVNNAGATPRPSPLARPLETGSNLVRRLSNSTLRSFAPPVVPTYLPRHMSSSFIPHVAYGKMNPIHTPPIKPPEIPAEQTKTRPPSPEPRYGLRKALSKLSLRTSRSRSRVSQLSCPPAFPLEFQHNHSSNVEEGTDRSGVELPHQDAKSHAPACASSRNSWRGESLLSTPALARGHTGYTPSRREWFDVVDRTGDELLEHTDELPLDESNTARDTVSTIGADNIHLPHGVAQLSGDDASYRAYTSQTIQKEERSLTHSPQQHQKSVQCEQTMFSFNDSDDDSDVTPGRQSKRTSKINVHRRKISKGTVASSRRQSIARSHQHKRSGSDQTRASKATTFLYTEPLDLATSDHRGPSLASLEGDCLTDSLPSLMESGSSRPTSWFSSHPATPMPPPLPLTDRKLLAQFESRMPEETGAPPTLKEIKRSAPSIVSDLKQGSSGNRIIAAISPEEAILIARIRRNRRSNLSHSSVTPSESTPKPTAVPSQWKSYMPPASNRQSRPDFGMRSRSAIPRLQQEKPRAQSQMFFNAPPTPSSRHSLRPSLSKPGVKVPLSGPAGDARRARVLSSLLTPSTLGVAPETVLGSFPTPPTPASTVSRIAGPKRSTPTPTHWESPTSELRASSTSQRSDSSGSPLTKLSPSSPQQSDSSGSPLTKLSPSSTPQRSRSPAESPATSSFEEDDRASRGDVMEALRALGG